MAGVLERLFERLEHLDADPQPLGEARRADRHDHEFLEVDGIVGVHAAVDDVHHRHRQQPRRGSAHVTVERQALGGGRRLGDRERDAEHGVGAEPALVGRAVERDQRLVDLALGLGVHPADGVEDLAGDGVDRLAHALAEIALVAVAQLDRLVRPGRGPRRHGGAAARPVGQHDVDLDGGIAAAVEDFTADDVDNGGHRSSLGASRASARASTGSTTGLSCPARGRQMSANGQATSSSRQAEPPSRLP